MSPQMYEALLTNNKRSQTAQIPIAFRFLNHVVMKRAYKKRGLPLREPLLVKMFRVLVAFRCRRCRSPRANLRVLPLLRLFFARFLDQCLARQANLVALDR